MGILLLAYDTPRLSTAPLRASPVSRHPGRIGPFRHTGLGAGGSRRLGGQLSEGRHSPVAGGSQAPLMHLGLETAYLRAEMV